MCRRNSCPSPTLRCAPSINPGTSQAVSRKKSGYSTIPTWGCSVLKRDRTRLWAGPSEIAVSKQGGLAGVGKSNQANVGNDAQLQQKIAFRPRLARLGEAERLFGVGRWQKFRFPKPPRPPWHRTKVSCPGSVKSTTKCSLLALPGRSGFFGAVGAISSARSVPARRITGRWLELAGSNSGAPAESSAAGSGLRSIQSPNQSPARDFD